MTSNTTFFDPSTATDLAKFQGSYAGIQAGNATVTGVAMAPTSIYNQAGFYAVQDQDTGYVSLQKLAGDSLYTKQWYDQGTGTIFDFTDGGTGITSTKNNSNTNSTSSSSTSTSSTSTSSTSSSTSNTNSTSSSTTNGLQSYPWGTGYVAVQPNGGTTTETSTNSDGTTSQTVVDENGDPVTLSAADLQEMVDAGIYDSLEEALNATLQDGYTVTDEEQAKLGIYSEADEEKIQMMMDKYGYTREEAISELSGKIEPKDDNSELQAKIDNLKSSGFTHEEAIEYMEALGYEIPEDMKEEPAEYSEEDEARIAALQSSTGCSREEAISALGCSPVEPDEPGLIRKAGNAIGGFFKGVGNWISDGWNSFVDWIW